MAIITLDSIITEAIQYIDTGYVAKSENYRIKMKFLLGQISSSFVLFGGGDANTDIISVIAQNPAKIYVGGGRVNAFDSIKFTENTIHDIDCHANNGTISVTFDGTTYTSTYSGTINKNYSMYLFANNQSGTPSMTTLGCIYGCQIYDNNELVRDYVPAMDSEGNIGLYDSITKRIYTSSSNYNFKKGIPLGVVLNGTSELTPIEYIESTGEQMICTVLSTNSNTKVVCDFEYTGENTENGVSMLFGNLGPDGQTGYYFGAEHENSIFFGDAGPVLYSSLSSYNVNRHTISLSATEILFDGDNVGGNPNVQFHLSGYMGLFSIFYSPLSDFYFYSKAKMYSCKIYEGDTLMADYKPYIYEGVAGLYNSVDKTFYPSTTTTPFIAGPEVSKVLDFESYPFGFRRRLIMNIDETSSMLPVGTTFDFPYTGTVQEITLPKGEYQLECWGAQGGTVYTTTENNGGYSTGILALDKETTLYVFVGEQPMRSYNEEGGTVNKGGWNGGGSAIVTSYDGTTTYCQGGGGGTDIALVKSSMQYVNYMTERSQESLLSRIIVAGGGAGMSDYNTGYKFHGGGINGGDGFNYFGGTQYSGGQFGGTAYENNSKYGEFGFGAKASNASNYKYGPSGGGGGWYGGGVLNDVSDTSKYYIYGCGGGSGFVNISSNAQYRPSGYTGLELKSGETIAGNEYILSPTGETEKGHIGNGFARITVLK